jgi:hypothetical protein
MAFLAERHVALPQLLSDRIAGLNFSMHGPLRDALQQIRSPVPHL